jgi:hypothetical protein
MRHKPLNSTTKVVVYSLRELPVEADAESPDAPEATEAEDKLRRELLLENETESPETEATEAEDNLRELPLETETESPETEATEAEDNFRELPLENETESPEAPEAREKGGSESEDNLRTPRRLAASAARR